VPLTITFAKTEAQFAPAAINVGDLYRKLGRNTEGETVLRAAIATSPQDDALGLALIA